MPSRHLQVPSVRVLRAGGSGPGTEQAEGSCSRDDVTNKVFAITDRAETSNVIIYAVLALLPLA